MENQKLSRRPKQTLFPRRHTDGQQAHEKKINIANYYEDENENHNGISPHICHMAISKKTTNNKS